MLTSQRVNPRLNETHSSAFNVRKAFGSDDAHPSAASVFTITHAYFPGGPIFVPPYFVPPQNHNIDQRHNVDEENDDVGERLHRALQRDAAASTTAFPETLTTTNSNSHLDPALQGLRPLAPKQTITPLDPSAKSKRTRTQINRTSASPSPEPNTPAIDQEREATWSSSSRQAFHAMITAPGYVNRYRLPLVKQQRLISCLQHPDVDPLNEDGSKDHQTKYQAAHWVLRDGKLYRKAEGKGKTGGLRRHLDFHEVWDVLTAEHLRSGHLGRDRLRKVLERRFIGYTLQEIMFVLRECRRCNGREKTQLPTTTTANHDPPTESVETDAQAIPPTDQGTEIQEPAIAPSSVPFTRKQTSNMMYF